MRTVKKRGAETLKGANRGVYIRWVGGGGGKKERGGGRSIAETIRSSSNDACNLGP